MKRINLDLDGVLFDFAGAAAGLMGAGPEFQVKRWDFHDDLGYTLDQMWELIRQKPKFWEGLQLLPHAVELVNLCEKLADEVHYVTHAGPDASCASGKARALIRSGIISERNIGSNLHITGEKKRFSDFHSVLIDDSPKNLTNNDILYPRPWNHMWYEAADDTMAFEWVELTLKERLS